MVNPLGVAALEYFFDTDPGEVDVADIATVIDIMAANARMMEEMGE